MIDLRKYLTPNQLADCVDYFELRARAWDEGWHHWRRIEQSINRIDSQQVEHCIPFEENPDQTMKVLHPSPRFISELMAGGIHPPIDAVHNQKLLLIAKSGKYKVVSKLNAPEWRKENGPIEHEIVVDNRRSHTETERALSYEEAIEYCIKKDIPMSVWGIRNNKPKFAIVERSVMPTDRTHRNNWKLKDLAA
jgi:hypothetical protein